MHILRLLAAPHSGRCLFIDVGAGLLFPCFRGYVSLGYMNMVLYLSSWATRRVFLQALVIGVEESDVAKHRTLNNSTRRPFIICTPL